MNKEKFTFTMDDLKPEVRAEFEEWLGFKVGDWEIINEIYRDEEEPLDSAGKDSAIAADCNLTAGRAKWVGEACDELYNFFFEGA